MNQELSKDLLVSIGKWTEETAALVRTPTIAVAYFGDESEEQSIQAALSIPSKWLNAFEALADGEADALTNLKLPKSRPGKFVCSHDTAKAIAPVLILISEPVPDFVLEAKSELDRQTADPIVRGFGMFASEFGTAVSLPVWKAYPDVAPEGWHAVTARRSPS